MFLLQCDETNLQATAQSKFFIYGGLIMRTDAVPVLTARVEEIRERAGFARDDSFKFQTVTRPDGMDQAVWNEAKSDVLTATADVGACLITCLVLHDLARNQREHLIEWQLDAVTIAFDGYLGHHDDYGLCVVDRLGDGAEYELLRTKFTHGGATSWSGRTRFERIVHFSSSRDGASHVSTAVDIALGSFRYCVNQRGDSPTPLLLYPKVHPLLEAFGRDYPGRSGIVFKPAIVQMSVYQDEYRALRAHLASLLPSGE